MYILKDKIFSFFWNFIQFTKKRGFAVCFFLLFTTINASKFKNSLGHKKKGGQRPPFQVISAIKTY